MSVPHPPTAVDLSGAWRAAVAHEDQRRRYHEDSFDDSAWTELTVPGPWRSAPSFSDADGPLLYRRRFEASRPSEGERAWLVLDGAFHSSDVWLDGSYVGDTEGYLSRRTFDVTEAARERNEHLLAIEVASSPPAERSSKSVLAGTFQLWDLLEGDTNPGGIHRPPLWETTGPVRLEPVRVSCRDLDQSTATIAFHATLDTDAPRSVELRTTVYAPSGEELMELTRDQHLAAGANHLGWAVAVPDPQPWWPWSLGDQPRYRVTTEALVDGVVSHSQERSIGLRKVAMRKRRFSVNGRRLIFRGATVDAAQSLAEHPRAGGAASQVAQARASGLDLLRVRGHVAPPELYEAADAAGMLVWQDLPLQWGYGRGVRRKARRQAADAVDLLAHHASVAIWGNTAVLDRSIARMLSRADGSRPVVTRSAPLSGPSAFDGEGSRPFTSWRLGRSGPFGVLLRPTPLRPGGRLDLDIHAVNNGDISFPDIVLRVDLNWRRKDGELAGKEQRAWQGQLPAEASVRAATIRSTAPVDAASLEVEMELSRPSGEALATNRHTEDLGPSRTWSSRWLGSVRT